MLFFNHSYCPFYRWEKGGLEKLNLAKFSHSWKWQSWNSNLDLILLVITWHRQPFRSTTNLTTLSVLPSGSVVKKPPAMQEMQVPSLDQEDPLKKGMATHSSSLAWRIPWTEEPGKLMSIGSQRVRPDWAADTLWINYSWRRRSLSFLHQLPPRSI